MKQEVEEGDDDYTTEFRQYDSDLGRWLSLDPLMAKYSSWNPYNFNFNNPINFTDVLGLEGLPENGKQGDKWTSDNGVEYEHDGCEWVRQTAVKTAEIVIKPQKYTPTPSPDINANKIAEKAQKAQKELDNDIIYQLYKNTDKNNPQYTAFREGSDLAADIVNTIWMVEGLEQLGWYGISYFLRRQALAAATKVALTKAAPS